ncbi:hypothetical protein R1flu_020994 [Riccia fluitans]|uniref:CCHC-type domain-containing protein n=1 Tax=Riccia fluitans TaxID=41844 RepID=A0ABD1ZQ37_9MARC
MAELKVHIAAPKEKRKEVKALCHDLWCSLCGNPGHTKEECRLPTAHTATTSTHWVMEAPASLPENYYAEGTDGHVYHVSMSGTSGNRPKFAPQRYNPLEYVGGGQISLRSPGCTSLYPFWRYNAIIAERRATL